MLSWTSQSANRRRGFSLPLALFLFLTLFAARFSMLVAKGADYILDPGDSFLDGSNNPRHGSFDTLDDRLAARDRVELGVGQFACFGVGLGVHDSLPWSAFLTKSKVLAFAMTP